MTIHGDIQPARDGDAEGRGSHGIEGLVAVADEAARLALSQVAPTGASIGDRTRVVWQLAGTPSAPIGAYLADGAGGWTFLGDTPLATETDPGVAELATQAETDAGTDDLRIITALKLTNFPGLGKFPLPVLAPATAMVADSIILVSATGTITLPEEPPENTLCGMLTVAVGERTVDASAEGALIVDPVGSGVAITDVQAYPNQNIFLTIWQYTTAPGVAAWMIVAQSPLIRFQPFDLPLPTPVAAVLQLGRTNIYDVGTHTSLVFPDTSSGIEDGAELITKSEGGTAGSSITLDGNGSDVENPSTGAIAGTAPTLGTTGEFHHWKWVAILGVGSWQLIG